MHHAGIAGYVTNMKSAGLQRRENVHGRKRIHVALRHGVVVEGVGRNLDAGAVFQVAGTRDDTTPQYVLPVLRIGSGAVWCQ